ncbi:MAG: beta-phosphoglucomutase family hydrolase [Ardenticatenaceae bacterium]|nr:beta-phosphoglucomutase family hydrolase [Ardenticatenaceae bacterium]MCB8986138.1 beta-phosphoglucomutase family hydrolase [Ardenticatenaceae bacterium]
MNQYEAFIFDMDGTLINNMPYHIQSWLALFADLGIHLTEQEFHQRLSGKTNAETVREVLGSQMTDSDITQIATRKEEQYRAIYGPQMQPVAGLADFLHQSQAAGVKTAVATSAGPDNIEFVLGGLGLAGAFTAVVGAHDVQNGKPHPEIFLTAAARLGVAPSACLVFEDSRAGIEAARRAGMDVVVITTALSASEAQPFANVITAAEDYRALEPRSLLGLKKT